MAHDRKQHGYTFRTRIEKDIVAEFMPPSRASHKAVIVCGGLPSNPFKKSLLRFLSARGFWVFDPRYRGSWESNGVFLRQSPVKDIFDMATFIRRGKVQELYGGKKFQFRIKKIFIVGSSFGGAVAIMASLDRRITKVVALSPVVDFAGIGGKRPSFLKFFLREGFKGAYRIDQKGWKNLERGKLMNPCMHVAKLDSKKIYILHSKDDNVVRYEPVKKFAKRLGCRFSLMRAQGHMSLSSLERNFAMWKNIAKFLRKS